ncbi:MAG: hypothetical protein DRP42_03380 [Tenericutes bacterium]|nr:MAG: hypothetical protein DRP42_03380 [Mycoplasmatota bacterium]
MFEGASDMMGVAMVIAVARGVSIVLGGTEVALELILIEGSEGATGTYIVEAAAHNGR